METTTIPVVDISDGNEHAAQQLLSAASTHGFVYVENNQAGVAPAIVEDIFDLATSFFAQPLSVKEQAAIQSNEAGSNVGWLRQGVEKLDPATQKNPDVKEALNITVPLLKSAELPKPVLPYEDLLHKFQQSCQALCLRLLRHFAVALQIHPDWFTQRHDQTLDRPGISGTIMRLLYYPSPSTSTSPSHPGITADDVRAGAHSDYGSLTLLFQLPGQPGLQIRNADGSWSSVPVDPQGELKQGKPLPILVNIGDLLEDWTAGLLKSTVHRVVFPADAKDAGDRYSVAYFCHPLDHVLLEPVPSALLKHNTKVAGPDGYITAKQHLQKRLAATYHINNREDVVNSVPHSTAA